MSGVQANVEKAPGGTFERIALVRAIPGRKLPLAIVHAFSATGAELAVQEKYAVSATGLDDAALDVLEQDARRVMSLRHPNLAAVRDVTREAGEVSVVSEFVEGEVLEELRRLAASSTSFSIEVNVRIVVDVLAALSALHTLDERGMAHGEVTTHNIIVGFDGATRLLRAYRGRVAGRVAEADWFGYAAPEVLKGQEADARADLFSVGVLLWEALTKRRLFPKATREGRTSRSVPIGKPSPPPDASWATPLAAVAERALASDPQARYASAAEMAAAVRLAVRSKLAMPPRVAAVVDKLAGERIVQRRVSLSLPEAPTRPTGPSRPSMSNEASLALAALRPSSRPPTPPPGPVIVPAVPKAPAVPTIEAREAKFHTPEPRPGPRPVAPALKLSEPKPPAPKLATAPIAAPAAKAGVVEPEPISLDSGLLSVAEASSDFGVEPPTIPKKKKSESEEAELAAPPAEMLEVVKAFEGQLHVDAEPAKPPPSEKPSALVDANVITSPAPQEELQNARQPSASSIAPAGIGAQRGRRVLLGVVAFCVLLLVGAGIRFLVAGKGSTPAPVATHRPHPTATQPAAPTATPAAPTATASATATEAAPEDSAAPSSSAASPSPEGSARHHHTKPRPTYDPMGI
jgi:serine/threonine protein kinase